MKGSKKEKCWNAGIRELRDLGIEELETGEAEHLAGMLFMSAWLMFFWLKKRVRVIYHEGHRGKTKKRG